MTQGLVICKNKYVYYTRHTHCDAVVRRIGISNTKIDIQRNKPEARGKLKRLERYSEATQREPFWGSARADYDICRTNPVHLSQRVQRYMDHLWNAF